jgi:hypothetical protein
VSDSPSQPPGSASNDSARLHPEDNDDDQSTAIAIQSEPVDTTSTRRMWIGLCAVVIVLMPRYSPFVLLLKLSEPWIRIHSFYGEILYRIVTEWSWALLVFLIMLWDGAPLGVFGLKKPMWSTDIITGCLTFTVDYALGAVGLDVFIGFLESFNYHIPKQYSFFHFKQPEHSLTGALFIVCAFRQHRI